VLTVTDVNDAPTSVPISPTAVVVGQAYSFSVAAAFSDVDAADTRRYAASGLPTGLSIDPLTGVISGSASSAAPTNNVTVTMTDAGNLSTSQTFNLPVVSAPTLLATPLAGATNLDVRSDIVLQFSESVTAVAGKKIRIINTANSGSKLGFLSESATNSFEIDAADQRVTVSGSKITINPDRDFDLSNNYSIEIDSGAFVGVTSKQGNIAVAGATAVAFSTVTPDSDKLITSTTGLSRIMQPDGSLADSLIWKDIEGWPAGKSGAQAPVDLLGKRIALVTADLLPEPGLLVIGQAATNVTTGNFNLRLVNFGSDDLIYMDDLGRNNPAESASDTVELIFAIQVTTDGTDTNFNFDPGVIGFEAKDGGNIDIAAQSFATVDEWKTLLQTSAQPFMFA
jgi:hypothetical protein